MNSHTYAITVEWTGNRGSGTSDYRSYARDHTIRADGPPDIAASADRRFRGVQERWNPEQLFIAALAQCHLLSYLHACADAGVVVEAYVDRPTGTLTVHGDGSGELTDVLLRPEVVVAAADQVGTAEHLHDRAHEVCFIARSVSCSVRHEPKVTAAARAADSPGPPSPRSAGPNRRR